jgi:ABC-type dipeptide/oligopeptide/nickel transport system permease component
LFAVLIITFTLGFYGPGDPISIFFGEDFDPDPVIIARLKKVHGLDRPYWVQFGDYVGKLLRGDWGKSIRSGQPIWRTIKSSMPISAQLGAAATVLLVAVGVPLGVLAAAKQNTAIDYWIISFSILVRSIPVFVLGPMLMIILVLWLDIMKTPVGWDGLFNQKAILPVALMAAGPLLVVVRQTRTGVLEVISQSYVRTARSKGLRERLVISRHVVKNALTPVLTSMGLILSGLITGALFVELIFGIPGFAGIGISAFRTRDYPLILAGTIIGTVIIILANLIVDLCYGLLDPRVQIT